MHQPRAALTRVRVSIEARTFVYAHCMRTLRTSLRPANAPDLTAISRHSLHYLRAHAARHA